MSSSLLVLVDELTDTSTKVLVNLVEMVDHSIDEEVVAARESSGKVLAETFTFILVQYLQPELSRLIVVMVISSLITINVSDSSEGGLLDVLSGHRSVEACWVVVWCSAKVVVRH